VPPEQAFGLAKPDRVHTLSRTCFAKSSVLAIGKLVRITDKRGRRRLVRVLKANNNEVVVDTNHRLAGQTVDLEVELILIHPANGQ
jgi:FKBP-type peptidyl-prolyl cis-trans isomerase SlpA